MSHINSLVLSGRIGLPPELKTTSSNKPMCSLRVAHARWDAKTRTENTEWYTVYAFDAEAERCARSLQKGAHVLIEGRVSQRQWTNTEGKKMTRCDVIANRVSLIGASKQPAQTEGAPKSDQEDMFVF